MNRSNIARNSKGNPVENLKALCLSYDKWSALGSMTGDKDKLSDFLKIQKHKEVKLSSRRSALQDDLTRRTASIQATRGMGVMLPTRRLEVIELNLGYLETRVDERGTINQDKASLVAQGWMSKSAFCMATHRRGICQIASSGFEDPAHPQQGLQSLSRHFMACISPKSSPSMVKDFEELMQKEFKMSSMGELTFFLGLQVKQTTAGIFLSQDKYVKDILNKFDFRTIKPASTPIEAHKSLGKDEEGEDVDVHLYRSMIGCLMYLTASRPDIMFAVCLCARFQVTPKVSHMHAVKRIFRYLKHQPKLGLWYPKDSPFHLEAFSDSDYAGDNHDRRSTSGGCQYLGRRLVSWQCKKQTIVAISSTEAEYVAAASCCAQVLWMQNQLLDYGFNFMNTEIHIDNESTICIVKNPVLHSKTKHIQIRHHFIRDCYEQRLINVVKVHTDDNVADLLTKGFDLARFNFLVVTIGMMNP
ncbi:putative ribonuclease H-like domain-containing protein [Tanacetum coccineum]|uniref:Ribonuclease H-like domain-containing protein n=1 Tax=Tanacetum coccineum TaxID=301880 RepID=A0ABQ5G5A0_9ASTR